MLTKQGKKCVYLYLGKAGPSGIVWVPGLRGRRPADPGPVPNLCSPSGPRQLASLPLQSPIFVHNRKSECSAAMPRIREKAFLTVQITLLTPHITWVLWGSGNLWKHWCSLWWLIQTHSHAPWIKAVISDITVKIKIIINFNLDNIFIYGWSTLLSGLAWIH